MIFKQVKRRTVSLIVLAFVLTLAIPAAYLRFTAPADPKFNGKRLSTHLYEAYGAGNTFGVPARRHRPYDQVREALRELGPKAAPLLTSWLENRPSPLRDKIRDILRKQNVSWPYFTADHQDIVERMLYQIPEAAVPVAEAFQYQIANGPQDRAMKWASLCVYVINSADAPSQKFIASRSGQIVHSLLDRFEKDGYDNYALHLVGTIIKHHPEHLTPELKERILRLVKKSRYLESAEAFIKSQRPSASSSSVAPLDLGHNLHRSPGNAQGHVVMPEAFEFVVPKDFAARCIEAEQMSIGTREYFVVVIEHGNVRITCGGEKAGLQLRAPHFGSAFDIDRGDVSVASDIQTLRHIAIVARMSAHRDYKTRGALQFVPGNSRLYSSQRG